MASIADPSRSAQDLLAELNASDETPRIEAKRASEVGKSLMETILAFANEPGLDGGWLLLGVSALENEVGDTEYRPEGIADPDKLQADLSTQCATMPNIAIRPKISVSMVEGKNLVVAYVPEAEPRQKPIYLKATGLPRGAFRRIGSTDQRCTEEDLWLLRGEQQPQQGPDLIVLEGAEYGDFDQRAIAEYRRERAKADPNAVELRYDDKELLEAIGALRRIDGALRPTVTGIVVFGTSAALRRLMPMLRIDYIRVPGTEWVEDPEARFRSLDIRKCILLGLPIAEASIVDELPRGFSLPDGSLQSLQEPLLPRKIVREALANAVMHRNYGIAQPIQIIRYSDRIEVRNPGYSLKDPREFGVPGSRLRNPAIAAIMHELHWAETKGSGIRTMRRLSYDAGLPAPEFISNRSSEEFRAVFHLHHLSDEADYAWLSRFDALDLNPEDKKVLLFARATGAVDNASCRDTCGLDTLGSSLLLRKLRDKGLLEKNRGGNRTYYSLKDANLGPKDGDLGSKDVNLGSKDVNLGVEDVNFGIKGGDLAQDGLPQNLRERIAALAPHASAEILKRLILDLCSWEPLNDDAMAELIGRDARYLRVKYLSNMVRSGELRWLYPDIPNHPLQAYVNPKRENPHDK